MSIRTGTSAKPTALIGVLLILGLVRATWHTQSVESPVLPDFERVYTVTGWVQSVEKSGSRERWRIRVSEMENLAADKTPKYVRVRIDTRDIHVGETVRFRAVLNAPPSPVLPGGYNPARAAYFSQIGGYGFAISKPERITAEIPEGLEHLAWRNAQFRFGLATRIREAAPEHNAGLLVALLTGIRTYITEAQTIALRIAGLAHILAISGLHMGLISGSVYYLATLLFALIIPVSRSVDVRKPAAVVAILAATAYLILSGASVATQRAFIMAVIVFIAVIINRRAFSLRSVAIAALITLLIHPEAILSAGFQMSFAAVTALVVVYRAWDARRVARGRRGFLARFWVGFASLSVTSIVAGAATGVFAAFHFNRIATWGLAGNLAAMPIFTFWVMPLALAVYVCLPFGLEAYPLWLMSQGLDLILWISNYVASWPNALTFVNQGTAPVLSLFVLGFIGLCLARSQLWRVAGVAAALTAFVLWRGTPVPDMRISAAGDVALWNPSGSAELWVDNSRRDRFGRTQFGEQAGMPIYALKSFDDIADIPCDETACIFALGGQSLSVSNHPESLREDCDQVDMIILRGRSAGMIAQNYCKARIIDQDVLDETGAMNVYVGAGDLRLEPVLTPPIKNRPWGRAFR